MKNKYFILGFLLSVIIEIFVITFLLKAPEISQDTIAVNEVMQSVTEDFKSIENHENNSSLDYVVLDKDGNVIFKTRAGLSECIANAISHRDTMLDVLDNNEVVGKVIIYNNEEQLLRLKWNKLNIIVSAIIFFQCIICILFFLYINLIIVWPFKKLKGFAERISDGNFDIPLEMDRKNIFGAFTESFDIMRSELNKSKIAEAEANKSKKELVAKLSHDIKTPIASIKAVSEVGIEVTKNKKDRENYTQIIGKADQVNTLITNLFTATLEELDKLSVTPENIESSDIKSMLKKADYLKLSIIPEIPECLIYADRLRLQQVLDNIFSNSYKYAKTNIVIKADKTEKYLNLVVEDFGSGIAKEELSTVKEKYMRGSNSKNIEGAGLGLYISDNFMKKMMGDLKVENGENGLKVTVCLRLSGKI